MTNYLAFADINCFVCDATDEKSLFQCGEWFDRYDDPQIQPQNCSSVHGARYCIKHIGRFEGNRIQKRHGIRQLGQSNNVHQERNGIITSLTI